MPLGVTGIALPGLPAACAWGKNGANVRHGSPSEPDFEA